MPLLPLKPKLKRYSGSQARLRQKAGEHNAMANRVADHLNTLVLNNPAEVQQYKWADVARDLGLTPDEVHSAIVGAGHNGIALVVTEDERRALASYKRRNQ